MTFNDERDYAEERENAREMRSEATSDWEQGQTVGQVKMKGRALNVLAGLLEKAYRDRVPDEVFRALNEACQAVAALEVDS